jgi:hypothetical protein
VSALLSAVFEQNCLKLRSVMEQFPSVAIRPHAKVSTQQSQQQQLLWQHLPSCVASCSAATTILLRLLEPCLECDGETPGM